MITTAHRFDFYVRVFVESERRVYASPNLPIIGSDNGLSPGRRQAIIWTNAAILSIRP